MSLQKVLSGSRALLARKPAIARLSGEQAAKNVHVMLTPPTVRMPLKEKIVLGLILSLSISIIPAWIAYHVPEYQQEQRPFKKNF